MVSEMKSLPTLCTSGWRRSGEYLYKPDLRRSCCPQYTIRQVVHPYLIWKCVLIENVDERLDATEFKADKAQRKLINKFNRYVFGNSASEINSKRYKTLTNQPLILVIADIWCRKKPPPAAKSEDFDLIKTLHSSETGFSSRLDKSGPEHEFTVR